MILYELAKFWDRFIGKLFTTLSILLLVCTIISAGNALIRKITGYSANSYLELQWMLFSAVFFLGASGLLKEDGHIRIDVLYQKFSLRTKNIINLACYSLLALPFFLLLTYNSLPFWFSSFIPKNGEENFLYYLFVNQSFFEISPNAGGLATPFAKLILPLGFSLLSIQSLSEIIKLSAEIGFITKQEHEEKTSLKTQTS